MLSENIKIAYGFSGGDGGPEFNDGTGRFIIGGLELSQTPVIIIISQRIGIRFPKYPETEFRVGMESPTNDFQANINAFLLRCVKA